MAAFAALPSFAGAAGPSLDPLQLELPARGFPVPRKPDLIVSRADQHSFTVKNVGLVTARTSWATVTTDRVHFVHELAPGKSRSYPIAACDLDSWGPMVIRVDAYRQVDELSELNNSATVQPLC